MTASITAPGVHKDMPEDVYHADPVTAGSLSCSWAKRIIKPGGAAKLRWDLDHGVKPKKTFDYGHAAHTLVLGTGPELRAVPDAMLAKDGSASTKVAKDFIAEARAEGAVPLKGTEVAEIKAMALQITQHKTAMQILNAPHVEHEVSAFRPDEQTGIWLRSRFDSIAPSVVGDYKTTTDGEAQEEQFAKNAARLGYHMQAAWYLDMAVALGLVERGTPFRFVVQEKTAPYLVNVVELGDESIALGRRENVRALDLWGRANALNDWAGYGDDIKHIDLPLWAFTERTAA